MAERTQKRDPDQTYSFGGELYGKDQPNGRTVAKLDQIAPNKLISTGLTDADGNEVEGVNSSPEETGSVNKDGSVVSHESSATKAQNLGGMARLSEDQLEGMTKSELEDEASKRGVTVTGPKGSAPLKADYVKALSK